MKLQDRLPQILQATQGFKTEEENFSFLLGSITAMSGCLSNVSGVYDQKLTRPNLFTCISAPPANGKGHLELCSNWSQACEVKMAKDGIWTIPSNITGAGLFKFLSKNDATGSMVDTEADSLCCQMASEYGKDLSGLFRKAFQNERYSVYRGSFDEVIQLKKPTFSILIAGTPEQGKVFSNQASIANGLFSRFMFYNYKLNTKFMVHVVSDREDSIETKLDPLFKEFAEVAIAANTANCKVLLTEKQWNKFNWYFDQTRQSLSADYCEDYLSGVINRQGVKAFKIMMVLTVLRLNKAEVQNELICSDLDFITALRITSLVLPYSLNHLKLMPMSKYTGLTPVEIEILEKLPVENFKYADGEKITKDSGHSERSWGYARSKFLSHGYIKQTGKHYQKV